MIVVVSYQNLLDYVASGKIYLFYNDNEFKNKNFELLDFRAHNNEKVNQDLGMATITDTNNSNLYIASTTNETLFVRPTISSEINLDQELMLNKALFKDMQVLDFENLNPKETRNLFYTFKTTPEMLKDTSATVKRLVRLKTLNFKTKFQNNGEGPARTIKLETDIPEMLDKSTFKVVDMYPKCPICPKNEIVTYSCLDTIVKKNQIHFIFKNIYLPGSAQKNVTEKDSTKGCVKSGYNYYPKLDNAKSYFLGATLSPYKSYRWYWQIETATQILQYNPTATYKQDTLSGVNGQRQLQTSATKAFNRTLNLEIPVLMRYNINNYFGVGAGLQTNINISEKIERQETVELYENTTKLFKLNSKVNTTTANEKWTGLKTGLVFDFTAGFARIGPSLGARYIVNFKENFNYIQLYGIWKF